VRACLHLRLHPPAPLTSNRHFNVIDYTGMCHLRLTIYQHRCSLLPCHCLVQELRWTMILRALWMMCRRMISSLVRTAILSSSAQRWREAQFCGLLG
jgi:hypothetical protein